MVAARPNVLDAVTEGTGRVIIDAGVKVHKALGPGLLEGVYRRALAHELRKRDRDVQEEWPLRVVYDGVDLGVGLRADLLVDDRVLVEVKALEAIADVHRAQLLTYLRASGRRLGFLLNFHAPTMRAGIRRVIHRPSP